eukprot:CAMPEP_0178955668 /NCGR_PEP_ID=MMETSP0789-20121207/9748_1 /TAXON_ID=3005 /ORGANISM="Rhizosolenia setigera, Strain CCMP 1694" /LENGTH=446 /DNA_ID=CAMNT_0020637355 /DNA_START=289 /DNA_END=1629 /DNA_ORIENTATION=+
MSDTGGGHRASANALRDAFDVLYGEGKIEVDIVDLYTDYGPFWPFNWYVPAYKIMAEYSFLWKAFYEFGATDFGLWLNEALLEVFCYEPFKNCLNRPSGSTEKRADMVVSVHPLCQDLPLKILCDLDGGKERKTPFVTVVTDLGGAHPTWFNPGVDKCYVPSDALYQCARAREVQPDQIVQYGLPIRKGFWGSTEESSVPSSPLEAVKPAGGNPFVKALGNLFSNNNNNIESSEATGVADNKGKNTAEKDSMRSQLGLKQSVPTILVVGGGDGMGGIIDVASALGEKLQAEASSSDQSSFQMVVVCGKNENAKETLGSKTWGEGINVEVLGFVNNMDEYMRASDAIVTKAGPGTIAEASICGLPCMLSSFLPGQEEGNVPFVEDSGFGKYSDNPSIIADTVNEWLKSPEMLQEMQSNALKAARPQATLDIARELGNMVFDYKDSKV